MKLLEQLVLTDLPAAYIPITGKGSENHFLGDVPTHSVENGGYEVGDDVPVGENVVLWWTPFTGIYGNSRDCSLGTCYFTENRDYLYNRYTKAVLFYGSDFNVEDLPLPRVKSQLWALLHEESPKNQPLFDHGPVLQLFNLTSTFRRGSNFPLTLQHLSSLEDLMSTQEFVPTQDKMKMGEEEELAPIIYVQSGCDTLSQRDKYVQELAKFIKIDSYGSCLHNRELPSHLQDPAASYDHPEFRAIVAKYRFALAIENAACEDYITEKLWRPLTVGTVPIYWGSPSIDDWIPNPLSLINIRTFESPRHLAIYLHKLLLNETLYELHLQHKLNKLITNDNLIQIMRAREWGINNDFERGNFIEHFECYVCNQIIKWSETHDIYLQADLEHYGCPEPQSVLTGKPDSKSFWVEEWNKARVEAEVLHSLILTEGVFSSDRFFSQVIDKLQEDGFFKNRMDRREEL
ncbi:Alpha-(1,3)-fucosyltransferase 11 [Halocaridina rubra]|uniref:Fucosyltransferase n=1 Tax=Halocaridina rubra TaxID=373956 RepID=A0AAN8XQA5_HALRR